MDPMTALSIAAAVVQFVDFSTSLLSRAQEAYKSASGQTKDVVQLNAVIDDLSHFSKTIQGESNKIENAQSSKDSTENILLKVCADCLQTCAEIQAAASKLGRVESAGSAVRYPIFGRQLEPRRALESIEIALKSLASSKQIRIWQDQLRQAREKMVMPLLGLLW